MNRTPEEFAEATRAISTHAMFLLMEAYDDESITSIDSAKAKSPNDQRIASFTVVSLGLMDENKLLTADGVWFVEETLGLIDAFERHG